MRLTNEGQLVSRLKEGDEGAFVELYNAYSQVLYSFLRKMYTREDDIRDTIQQVFIKLWEKRSELNPQLSLQAYLMTIARHDITDMVKKQVRARQYSNSQPAETPQPSTEHAMELRQLLQTILPYLPDKRREVFSLSRIEGFSNEEIATLLNISKKTVENHINHSAHQLKGIIKRLNSLG